MGRHFVLRVLSSLAVTLLIWNAGSAALAQGDPTAQTISNLNVRTGPGTEYAITATIPIRATVYLEGRNRTGNWVLINGGPGGVRGWAATRYLVWPDSVDLGSIPVVEGAAAAPGSDTSAPIGTGAAVEPPNAWPADRMNLREGPDTAYPSLGLIPAGTGLVLEGRTGDSVWALVHTADRQARGWVVAGFLRLDPNVALEALPVANGSIDTTAPAQPQVGPPSAGIPFDDPGAIMTMLLNDIPIIPTIGGRTREIYQDGLSQGRNPYVFAKVGDSNSVRTEFLGLISYGLYDLGPYGYLQETIDYYRVPIGPGLTDPFLRQSYAAQPGYTAWFASDPRWHHPACPDLTPVECEYSHINPSVALILFGMADIRYLTYPDYEQAMRRIIEISIRRGIVPVLYTFPVREDARPGEWETSLRFNNVLVNLAREYQVPLVNLWRAVYPLPDHGVDADQTHLSIVDGTFNRFTGDENRGGYTMWNLVTLQTLDAIRCSVN